MKELIQLSKNVSELSSNWATIIDKFFDSFEGQFIDLLQDQLLHGKDGDGGNLATYATVVYADYKKAIGSISVPFADLKNHGDFYDGMFVNNFNEIDSTDWKTSRLVAKYGDSILDIQEDKLTTFVTEQMIPELAHLINTKLMQGL